MTATAQPIGGGTSRVSEAIIEEARRRSRRRRFGLLLVVLVAATVGWAVYSHFPDEPAGSRSPASSAQTTGGALALKRCPTNDLMKKGTPTSAAGWSGSVSGIGCEAAGQTIAQDFAAGFMKVAFTGPRPFAEENLAAMKPGTYEAGGFDCAYGRHDPAAGWPVTCRSGGRVVVFTLSP